LRPELASRISETIEEREVVLDGWSGHEIGVRCETDEPDKSTDARGRPLAIGKM
jgi:hypothetical protein